MQYIIAILAICLLVIVHEFGHFITAKRSGIQVNEFWVGMGPTLLKKEWRGTLYCLKLLPIGGACVMEGEDEDSENPNAFGKASLPRRILVVVAGALMNFIVGFLILLAITAPNGPEGGYIVSTLAEIDPQSTAAGILQPNDTILSVDGYTIFERSDFSTALARGTDTDYDVVVRRDGKRMTLSDVPLAATITGEDGQKRIGLTFAEKPATLFSRIEMSARAAVNCARLVWVSLGMLITGQVGLDQMSGLVGVTKMAADVATVSLTSFFYLVAFISINLGVMNLLPLPALDGGRLVFLLIEAVRRKPVPAKYEGWVHAAGMLFLLALMLLITGQDIIRLVTGGFAT